mgnify:CR=1 FL=1
MAVDTEFKDNVLTITINRPEAGNALNAEVGTEVEIGKLDGHQKRLPAKIVKFAAYDPEKTRPRS